MTESGLEVGNVDCQEQLFLHLPSNMDQGELIFSSHAWAFSAVNWLALWQGC